MSTEKHSELSKPIQIFKHPAGRNFWSVSADSNAGQQDIEAFYSQEYVYALLTEIGRVNGYLDDVRYAKECCENAIAVREKRIAELEQEPTIKHMRSVEEALISATDRASELEAKLATPVRLLGEMLVHDWEHSVERQAAFQHRKTAWDARLEEDKKAIRAAGFTFTVEGDE